MADRDDWYPNTQAGEREMYAAILANIDEVDKTLNMEADTKLRLKNVAQVFIGFYDNLLLNRAAGKSLGTAFSTVMHGKKGTDPMPALPLFHNLTLPVGDFVGLETEMREIRRYMIGLFTWTDSMGDVLKMNGSKSENQLQPGEMSPALRLSDAEVNKITSRAKKQGMDGIEYQWRVAGEEIWQPLIISGEAETILEIPVSSGAAYKIEIRAIFVQKFRRVGNWSPTYNATVSN
jgi:hypothetical protein